MADIQEAIRRLRYIFSSEGADKVVSDQAKVGAAVTASSTTQEKASLSLDKSFAGLERRYVSTVRQQQDYAKVQDKVNAAVQQNPALQERANVVLANAALHFGQAGAGARAFAAATSGVSGQLIALSAGAGPVGVFLAALGPWGVAAAIGLTGVTKAFGAASNSANHFASEMLRVRDSAETLNVTTVELQAINDAGAKFALTEDRIAGAMQRFTAQLDETRRGQGELYSLLLRIDPALAREMALSRDTASAMDILGKAYEAAGTSRQKLDRLIGGRNGGTLGLLFQDIGRQGLGSVTADFKTTGDAIDKELIDKIARLKAEIDDMSSDASRNLASIYSAPVLQMQHTFNEKWLEFSRSAKSFSLSGDWSKFIDDLGSNKMIRLLTLLPLLEVVGLKGRAAASGAQSFDESGFITPRVPLPMGRPTSTIDRSAQEFEINTLSKSVAAMGSAANAADKLALIRKKAALDLQDHIITETQYRRVIGIAGEETAATAINARIGLLGLMATSTEINTQSQYKLNAANRQGANIYGEQARLIKEADVLRAEGAKQNAAAQFGLVSEMEILNQKNKEYINITNQLGLEQTAAGYALIARNARAAWEASQVAASAHPQLTQLGFDTLNLNKQFDQFAVGGVNNLTTALADISMGTKQTGDAFRSLGLTVVRALQEMIIKMMIFRAMSMFTGGGGGLLGLLGLGGGGSLLSVDGSAKGNVFDQGRMIRPYALGGIMSDIVTRPTLFPMARGAGLMGEAGPEAIMPLRRGPDGRLGVSGQGGGGTVINVSQVNNITGSPDMSKEDFMALLAKNNKDLTKQINAALPDRVAAINRDPRKRGN